MAANLIYLKSRSLLPRDQQPPEEDAAEDDPRWELIRQLIEYKKFKEAAAELNLRALEQERIFIREAGSDRKSTRLNSSHSQISYAVFCLKKTDGNVRGRAPAGPRRRPPAHFRLTRMSSRGADMTILMSQNARRNRQADASDADRHEAGVE